VPRTNRLRLACFLGLLVGTAAPAAEEPVPVTHLAGHSSEIYTVAFSADGQLLASASGREVKVWDVGTGKERLTYAIKGSGSVYGLAFSPDGGRVAVGVAKQVKVLDARTGQEVLLFPQANQFLFRLGFSPDGKRLAASSGNNGSNIPGEVAVWEADTGRPVYCLRGPTQPVLNVAYSRDGRLLAASSGATNAAAAGEVKVWDAATRRELHSLHGHADNVYAVTFTVDGRFVASGSGVKGASKPGEIKLWEVLTGQVVWSMPAPGGPIYGIMAGPDGRWLATAGGDGKVKIWDAIAGKESLSLAGSAGPDYGLSLSRDGRWLAAAGQDRVVRIWDLAGHVPEPTPQADTPGEEELVALWTDLGGPDAARAYRSAWRLASAPKQAVPFLCTHLHAVTPLSQGQRAIAAAWLHDLDDNRFKVRERATKELSRLGEAAIPVLRDGLAGKLSQEPRRRVEQLLAAVSDLPLSGERLAAFRSLTILEHSETPDARTLLEQLAAGLPDARLTTEARATIDRLGRRPMHP
jgi:outer membrane protein assembly factor BamB